VAGGRVFVGTNNDGLRNPEVTGDRGVVMAFNEADGAFLWQQAYEKLAAGRIHDWPQQGICSTPFVEGDRLWYTFRHELCRRDAQGRISSFRPGFRYQDADRI